MPSDLEEVRAACEREPCPCGVRRCREHAAVTQLVLDLMAQNAMASPGEKAALARCAEKIRGGK